MRRQGGKAGLGWIVALVVILAGAGGAYFYFGRDALTSLLPGILSTDKTSANSTPLVLVKPETRMVDATVLATGIIRLRVGAEVRVGAQISGIVSKLNVTVGAHVNKGDVIAEIDARSLQARIAQAKAQVDLDEASLQKTRLDLIRAKRLVAAGVVPHQQLEDQEAMVALSIAKVEKSKRDLAVIATDLNFVTIRASKSGTIASVSTQEGETVATQFAAPTFVTIIEDNALELIALVDETDIANVRASNPVMFTTETFPAREFAGTVQRIAPKATIVSGVVNYEVGIAIEKGLDILKPDMTANVSIKTARHKALVVPQNAVHRDGDERFVYVARDGKPEKRRITIGIRDAGFIEIKKGLKAEEQVVAGDLPAGAQEKKG